MTTAGQQRAGIGACAWHGVDFNTGDRAVGVSPGAHRRVETAPRGDRDNSDGDRRWHWQRAAELDELCAVVADWKRFRIVSTSIF
jgi:hypothetical protein